MPPGFPELLSKIDVSTPIHTTKSPILTTFNMLDRDIHMPPSLYSIALLKALRGMTDMSKEKETEGLVPNHEEGSSQQPRMN